ncbi:hypothetical protein THASP1DRAFT_27171 [Thamnocephalis sphaerospora]|uniref:Uncharacterized protein n=1 Tax=Thamnocephalis sphaerospora TaxID=78915 RepID=A0A4P9XZ95_9FUNG|nr:hypothetical protein THASP1DRAFT_27171 [Thamnocephalis sphaerospora]|eukprot:RKP11071.1 hypothetical protein THASP1DRAFT_27171 [Thamnocephalis sphaerospora]
MSSAAIGGIVLGGIAGAVVLLGAMAAIRKYRRRKARDRHSPNVWKVNGSGFDDSTMNSRYPLRRSSQGYFSPGELNDSHRASWTSRYISPNRVPIGRNRRTYGFAELDHAHHSVQVPRMRASAPSPLSLPLPSPPRPLISHRSSGIMRTPRFNQGLQQHTLGSRARLLAHPQPHPPFFPPVWEEATVEERDGQNIGANLEPSADVVTIANGPKPVAYKKSGDITSSLAHCNAIIDSTPSANAIARMQEKDELDERATAGIDDGGDGSGSADELFVARELTSSSDSIVASSHRGVSTGTDIDGAPSSAQSWSSHPLPPQSRTPSQADSEFYLADHSCSTADQASPPSMAGSSDSAPFVPPLSFDSSSLQMAFPSPSRTEDGRELTPGRKLTTENVCGLGRGIQLVHSRYSSLRIPEVTLSTASSPSASPRSSLTPQMHLMASPCTDNAWSWRILQKTEDKAGALEIPVGSTTASPAPVPTTVVSLHES